MADTFSSLLRVRLQQTGANNNTWGSLLNTAVAQLLEDAIAGVANITVASSDVTLTQANGANDQSRMAVLNLTGTPGAVRNIIVPASSKAYLVINDTGFAMTVKTATGTGVAVANGTRQYVYCNGTNVVSVQADPTGTVAVATDALKLGGVDAVNYARKDAFNQHTKGFATTFVGLTDAATVVVDCAASNRFRVVLAGNRALSLTNPADGQTIEIWFVQDAGGGRTIAWPGNVRFGGGSSATLSTAANAVDVYRLTYHESSDLWVAQAMRNVAAASGATTFDVTLDSNTFDLHLFTALGSPSGIVTVNLTLAPGVIVAASSPGTPAIDTRGFDSGSEINIYTAGAYVHGHGGRGGKGSGDHVNGSGNHGWSTGSTAGHPGSPAIYGPGTGRTLNIHNAGGYIRGGGGGGGGAGASVTSNGGRGAGGGGGGGAGGGDAGDGGAVYDTRANNGTAGSAGVSGTFGAGGTGATSGGATGGTGGAGGEWGANGSAGGGSGGAGGAAGKAVEVNGATVTFLSGGTSPNVKGAVS